MCVYDFVCVCVCVCACVYINTAGKNTRISLSAKSARRWRQRPSADKTSTTCVTRVQSGVCVCQSGVCVCQSGLCVCQSGLCVCQAGVCVWEACVWVGREGC